MKCKNHPTRNTEKTCPSCKIPICDDCAEEVESGYFLCLNCAMLQAVSVIGGSLVDKKKKVHKKQYEKKKSSWGLFQYFVISSCILVSIMLALIIFGGDKAPGQKMDYSAQRTGLLFIVDSAIRRYYHYENKTYPDNLFVLVPKYLRMVDEDLIYLHNLSYKKDAAQGYSLSLIESKPENQDLILSPKDIRNGENRKDVE